MDITLIWQTLVNGSLVILVVAIFFGGLWISFISRGQPRQRNLGLMIAGFGLWLLSYILWRLALLYGHNQAVFWLRMVALIGSFLPTLLVLYASSLNRQGAPPFWHYLVFLPNLALGWLVFGTGSIVSGHAFGVMYWAEIGSYWLLLPAFFAAFFVLALGLLLYASHRPKAVSDTAWPPMLIGIIVSFYSVFTLLFSSPTALLRGGNLPWLTIVATIIGLFIMSAFSLERRFLIDLRMLGVEAAVFLALFVFLADIVTVSESWPEFIFRVVIIALLIIYGTLATRTVVTDTQHLRDNEALREQLVRTNGQLLEANRAKTRFVAFAAHQLRSPLDGLYAYMTLIMNGEFGQVPEQVKEVAASSREVIERLSDLTATFLNVTRIESGRISLYRTESDLNRLAEKIVDQSRPVAERKGLKLELRAGARLPKIYCDETYIHHVLSNLVDNAIKYTEGGQIEVSISRCQEDGFSPGVEIRVKDSGMGLTERDRKGLFDVFQRGISAVNLQAKGEGLGLYIVKQFIEAHGGQVFFDSTGQGQGSTFGFRLPAGQPD